MIAYTLSDLIVHVERCVIASSTRGDFGYCIATWLRAGAVYDLNLRLIRLYRHKYCNSNSFCQSQLGIAIPRACPIVYGLQRIAINCSSN